MKIQLVSDLHLEFSDVVINNQGYTDVLILGGDILTATTLHEFPADDADLPVSFTQRGKAERFRQFLKHVSKEFPHVVYIAGNHEYYHGKFPDAITWLKDECSLFPNVYFLEMDSVEIKDYVFIGSTLWTDLNKGDPTTSAVCKTSMNDYHVIRDSTKNYSRLSPSTTLRRHRDSLSYIKSVVESDPSRQYVVVGHHAPTMLSTKPQFEKDFHLNGAYRSDLSEFIINHPQIKLWTHGHTHNVFDYVMGSTRILCNPRGYEGYEDDSGWDPNMVITL